MSCASTAAVFFMCSAVAGTDTSTPKEKSSPYERLWSYATLYENKDNPVIQKLAFVGRVQADAAFFEGNEGSEDFEKLLWRRVR